MEPIAQNGKKGFVAWGVHVNVGAVDVQKEIVHSSLLEQMTELLRQQDTLDPAMDG
jgi:hypothetical protein